jgi:hypothetical protein
MKRFKSFLESTAGVPTNVTGPAVSTDQPVVQKRSANKYKKQNAVKEGNMGITDTNYTAPDETSLYVMRNNNDQLKISKLLKRILKK